MTCDTHYRQEARKFKDTVLNYNHCVVIVIVVVSQHNLIRWLLKKDSDTQAVFWLLYTRGQG